MERACPELGSGLPEPYARRPKARACPEGAALGRRGKATFSRLGAAREAAASLA